MKDQEDVNQELPPIFPGNELLASKGLSLVKPTEENNVYEVVNKEGKTGRYDITHDIVSNGFDPKKVEVQFNDKNSPIPYSTVSAEDRHKLSFGNEEGSLEYLKRNFQDSAMDKDKGLLVKKNNVWQVVDEATFKRGNINPFSLSEKIAKRMEKDMLSKDPKAMKEGLNETYDSMRLGELGKDALEAVPMAISLSTSGLGASMGGPGGAGLGAVAGSAINRSLGRYYGTYKSTLGEDMVDDVGEFALNMFGMKFLPTAGQNIKEGLSKAATKAGSISKDVVAGMGELIQKVTSGKVTSEHFDRFTKNKEVINTAISDVREALKLKGNYSAQQVIDGLENRQINTMYETANSYKKAVKTDFLAKREEMYNSPEANRFYFENQRLRDMGDGLAGKVEGTDDLMLSKALIKKNNTSGKYEVLSAKEISGKIIDTTEAPDAALNIAVKTQAKLKDFVTLLNANMTKGDLKGKEGLKSVMEMKRLFGEVSNELETFKASKHGNTINLHGFLIESEGKLNNEIGGAIGDTVTRYGGKSSKLVEAYNKSNEIWRDNVDFRKIAMKTLNKVEDAKSLDGLKAMQQMKDEYIKLGQNSLKPFYDAMGKFSANKANLETIRDLDAAKPLSSLLGGAQLRSLLYNGGKIVGAVGNSSEKLMKMAGKPLGVSFTLKGSAGSAAEAVSPEVADQLAPKLHLMRNAGILMTPEIRDKLLNNPSDFSEFLNNVLGQ